jgi:hypothetical protein
MDVLLLRWTNLLWPSQTYRRKMINVHGQTSFFAVGNSEDLARAEPRFHTSSHNQILCQVFCLQK